jgi:hypothetical protein
MFKFRLLLFIPNIYSIFLIIQLNSINGKFKSKKGLCSVRFTDRIILQTVLSVCSLRRVD